MNLTKEGLEALLDTIERYSKLAKTFEKLNPELSNQCDELVEVSRKAIIEQFEKVNTQ